MIIMGYPGIGKTSVAKDDYRFIDLDSSDMLIRGKFANRKGWEDTYCNLALMLSKQGYFVFVSTHQKVRNIILARDPKAVLVYPDISLKDKWIKRLYDRYADNRCRQTHNAWLRAKDHFDEDFSALEKTDCPKIILANMEYKLKQYILELHDAY